MHTHVEEKPFVFLSSRRSRRHQCPFVFEGQCVRVGRCFSWVICAALRCLPTQRDCGFISADIKSDVLVLSWAKT